MLRKKPSPSKYAKRIARIPTADLFSWAEQAGYGVMRNVEAYQRRGAEEHLMEAIEGTEALLAVLQEIKRR